ncbi:hypothetical protein SSBR45G_57370 [Bradyrhizobium sp. SSBR45G]|uniref:serine/threonine-protein kinase n=1 Tax=unclassified Bradyrhizobium TaxID=2631580 RepID=UPI002342AD35|nr:MULTISPECIES: serine/threonine-protein kinase [unclassified Bradyrhizobium]GLH80828.1 hypothetical protein SSBR45G_57370 [Bradyrhizobium sp. SSBR45G]GLH88133.1 hypothetical protein SSBR45R_55940 [Bradyrhizobium sp. SSBR45R]
MSTQDPIRVAHKGVPSGTRLNGIYEVDRLIGVGGVGEVYRAHEIQTGTSVAIKMLLPEMAEHPLALELFRREAAALHYLMHDAIVRYFVFTVEPVLQRPYLAMEFVEGRSLADMLDVAPLSFDSLLLLTRRVASGLRAAHERGVIHRDLSPSNVIVPQNDFTKAKIIDFGIARSTRLSDVTVIGSALVGTHNYASPEQVGLHGGEVSWASDVYSLGLVLFYALTGEKLNMSGTMFQLVEKRRRVPDLRGIDKRIRPLLDRMLQPNPKDRPTTAEIEVWAIDMSNLKPVKATERLASSEWWNPFRRRRQQPSRDNRLTQIEDKRLAEERPPESKIPPSTTDMDRRRDTLERLAELASPQPSINLNGRLDVHPNQAYDIPSVEGDIALLPLRQRNLVKVILGDLPKNAPGYLRSSLRSYDRELKVRGSQPILGLLKDDAGIIAAAVSARHAEDEWLEPGMRTAFDLFDENHRRIVEHFPLDATREAVYGATQLREDQAEGNRLTEPFETVSKAALEAHKAGATTDEFLAVIDKMTEFARVISTQPSEALGGRSRLPLSSHGHTVADDRLSPSAPVTMKKRVILGALGFFERTYNLIGTSVTIATASYGGIAAALRSAIEQLVRLLG